ncbi:MAG: (2Fe-2S) ferredoxin domain-containing protein [Myxococcales bacterium]|nr:(2Fe-2S) ferredoxin domain-containing protein [Myxococcales bacterium]
MPPLKKDLESAVLAFVVQWGGAWPDRALRNFRNFLDFQGILPDEVTLGAALSRARARFLAGDAALFRCVGSACVEHAGDAALNDAVADLARRLGTGVEETDCLGACAKAPTVVVRMGERAAKVSRVDAPEVRAALGRFVGEAPAAD